MKATPATAPVLGLVDEGCSTHEENRSSRHTDLMSKVGPGTVQKGVEAQMTNGRNWHISHDSSEIRGVNPAASPNAPQSALALPASTISAELAARPLDLMIEAGATQRSILAGMDVYRSLGPAWGEPEKLTGEWIPQGASTTIRWLQTSPGLP